MEETPSGPEPLKEMYNRAAIERLAARLEPHVPGFDAPRFIEEIVADLPRLELLQRVDRITRALHDHLPKDYPAALAMLLEAVREDAGGNSVGLEGFQFLPFNHFVGAYGLEHPELSLDALHTLTKRFTCEWDIRPFIQRHPAVTLPRIAAWARDPDPRVRRLSSEGMRPRLPWAGQLKAFIRDPEPVLEVLELLKDDPDEWVRRSVANNLNDIAKDHPERVIALARRWREGASPERQWILRHALRTLVKKGHPEALELLGFSMGAALEVRGLSITHPQVRFGGGLSFSFELESRATEPLNLSIDYAVHHRKANGGLTPKVFKLSKRRLEPGERCRIERAHAIRPITTRQYYPGVHRLELLINGRSFGMVDFELLM